MSIFLPRTKQPFFQHMPAENQTHNTRHKSLKQKAFVLNFLQISFIHSSHLCSHSNVPLSFPNGEPRVFWSTEMTAIPKSTLGKGEITQVFQDLWRVLQALLTQMQLPSPDWSCPEGYAFPPFQLTCSTAEKDISVRRISSPGRTSLAGTALVASSSEPLCQESCYDRKLKHLLSDPASSLRNHPMYLRIHLAVFHISHIRDQHQTEGFSEDVTRILLSATRASICACRFVSGTSLVPYEAWPPLLPRGSRGSLIYIDYAKKASFSTTVTPAFFCILST